MKKGIDDIVFDTVKILILTSLLIVTIYPSMNVLAVSLNDSKDTIKGGIGIFPREFTLFNYKQILKEPIIATAAVNSVTRTVIAVITAVLSNAMVAYALSRPKFLLKKPIGVLYVITLYVNGGLIPTFFLIKALGLLRTFSVYWLPSLTSAFSILVLRTYMKSIHESLIESAKMEGANDLKIFFKIMLPLCKPVLATIALFVAVDHWNMWFDTMVFNGGKKHLTVLQYELVKKLQSASSGMASKSAGQASQQKSSGGMVTPTSLRAAMTIIVSVPIMLVYPFLQKYFVKGLTIGGVKG